MEDDDPQLMIMYRLSVQASSKEQLINLIAFLTRRLARRDHLVVRADGAELFTFAETYWRAVFQQLQDYDGNLEDLL